MPGLPVEDEIHTARFAAPKGAHAAGVGQLSDVTRTAVLAQRPWVPVPGVIYRVCWVRALDCGLVIVRPVDAAGDERASARAAGR
jgi:hypothetical protein